MDLSEFNGKIICQKDAFLAAAKGVSVGIEFQRKIGAGFFGGEGFIMQKLEGDGFVLSMPAEPSSERAASRSNITGRYRMFSRHDQ